MACKHSDPFGDSNYKFSSNSSKRERPVATEESSLTLTSISAEQHRGDNTKENFPAVTFFKWGFLYVLIVVLIIMNGVIIRKLNKKC